MRKEINVEEGEEERGSEERTRKNEKMTKRK